MRRRSAFVIAACALVLGGCSADDKAAEKQKVLKAYTDCLRRAASKLDDGKRDSAEVAKAIGPLCASEYEKVVRLNEKSLDPQSRSEFEAAMQAKQREFATTVVLDRRKTAK